MKITIVMGFFLPMPPEAGGSTEKSWHRLAIEFARAGHEVLVISRRWFGWSNEETLEGVQHLRLKGYDHTDQLVRNLFRDLRWSWRVYRHLPPADITIVNCVTLPLWLGRFRRQTGRLVLMSSRVPKGQFRHYRHLDSILVASQAAKRAILEENPRWESILHVHGLPIDWSGIAQETLPPAKPNRPITIGFVGRFHREKGLGLLVSACETLALRTDLPPWRVLICGPRDVTQGGSGATYAATLERRLRKILPGDRSQIMPAAFHPSRLYPIYREIDIFCYPSLSAREDTFSVPVAEAMAAGAIPMVPDLPSFQDIVQSDYNGVLYPPTDENSPEPLAERLASLIQDASRRNRLSNAARDSVYRYDFPLFASRLLADFATLAVISDSPNVKTPREK